jgi:hypothetical protein
VKNNIGPERHSQRKSLVIDMGAHDLRGLITGILLALGWRLVALAPRAAKLN